MSTPEQRLARLLRSIRIAADVSQREFAERLKAAGVLLHQASVSRIEAETQSISLNEAVAMSTALGFDLGAVLGEQDTGMETIIEILRRRPADAIRERDDAIRERNEARAAIRSMRQRVRRAIADDTGKDDHD